MNKSEFEASCRLSSGAIFVREQIDGRWRTVSLAELSPELQQKHIDRWWDEGRMPVVLAD